MICSPFEFDSSLFLSTWLCRSIVTSWLDAFHIFYHRLFMFLLFWHSFDPIRNFLHLGLMLLRGENGLIFFDAGSFLWLRWYLRNISNDIRLIDLHKMNEFSDRFRTFGVEVFILFHFLHLMMESCDYWYKLLLLCLFSHIKLDNSFLKDVEESVDAVIIGLFLKSGCKSWIYWHMKC